jgi:hypothetical protein
MTQEFIPSTVTVREMFAHGDSASYEDSVAAFDRWLAAHDAQIRAEAWDEGHTRGWMDGMENTEPTSPNPYRKENYLYKSNGLQHEEVEQ